VALLLIFFPVLVTTFSEEFSNFIKELKKKAILFFLRKKEFMSSRQTDCMSCSSNGIALQLKKLLVLKTFF